MSRTKRKPQPTWLNAHQMGRLHDVHWQTIYRLHRQGKLPVNAITVGVQLRWSTEAVLASLGLDELPDGVVLDDEQTVTPPAVPRRRSKATT